MEGAERSEERSWSMERGAMDRRSRSRSRTKRCLPFGRHIGALEPFEPVCMRGGNMA